MLRLEGGGPILNIEVGRFRVSKYPAFQTKLLSSVTSAGAAVLVEEKLGSRATYREKNSISQNVSET